MRYATHFQPVLPMFLSSALICLVLQTPPPVVLVSTAHLIAESGHSVRVHVRSTVLMGLACRIRGTVGTIGSVLTPNPTNASTVDVRDLPSIVCTIVSAIWNWFLLLSHRHRISLCPLHEHWATCCWICSTGGERRRRWKGRVPIPLHSVPMVSSRTLSIARRFPFVPPIVQNVAILVNVSLSTAVVTIVSSRVTSPTLIFFLFPSIFFPIARRQGMEK